jgi:hypothetical protein
MSRPGKVRISTGGRAFPIWRRDGRELFYLAPNGALMSTDIRLDGTATVSAAKVLFKMCNPAITGDGPPYFDVSADGKRVIVSCASPQAENRSLTVVAPWTQLVKRLQPDRARP